MKLVTWTDSKGYKHLSLLREDDPNALAPSGLLIDPPDVDDIDWNVVKRDLHNALVERRLSTWKDVQSHKDAIKGAVLSVLHRRVVDLYKNRDQNTRDKAVRVRNSTRSVGGK